MKKAISLFITILVIFLTQCDPDNSNSWKGRFIWRGTISATRTDWIVSCNNSCTECTADGSVNGTPYHYTIYRNKYPDVYKMCDTLPNRPPERPEPIDTTDTDPTPTGKAHIYKTPDCEFGYDSWHDHNDYGKCNYIDLATSCSTSFGIHLDSNLVNGVLYDSVLVIIPSIAFNKLSFSPTVDVYRKKISQIENTIKLYSKSNTTIQPIGILIQGINDPNKPVCLVGDCSGSEDKLQVMIYNKKTFGNYRVYHHQGYTQTDSVFRNEFNRVLKQAVVEIGSQVRTEQDHNIWDINHNAKMDHFPGYLLLDQIGNGCRDEFSVMVQRGGEQTRCNASDSGATFLVDYPIRQNWVVINNPVPDTSGTVNVLEMERVDDLYPLDLSVNIGYYNRTVGDIEIAIIDVDTANNRVYVCRRDSIGLGLPNIFNIRDTVVLFRDNVINGVTKESCSCSKSNLPWSTHIHEFLHQVTSGRLAHVADTNQTDNIMYPYSSKRTGTNLRYRSLYTLPGTSQMQWDTLHK